MKQPVFHGICSYTKHMFFFTDKHFTYLYTASYPQNKTTVCQYVYHISTLVSDKVRYDQSCIERVVGLPLQNL